MIRWVYLDSLHTKIEAEKMPSHYSEDELIGIQQMDRMLEQLGTKLEPIIANVTKNYQEKKDSEKQNIENQEDVLDLYLMSKIHNNIIANSSFSWWGAWLNEIEDKKVLTPSAWFGPKNTHLTMKDLIPETWEMVE